MGTPKNQSVMKAFVLLRAFRRPDEWLTSSELSRRAKMPEASGYRMMQTLEGIGAVVRDARGRYRPGMLLLELSNSIDAQDLWRTAAQSILESWSQRLDVTVQIGVYEEGMVTYVARAGRPRGSFLLAQGMQFEAYCTALGKILLAELPEDDLKAFFEEGELVAFTPQTITREDRLRAELQEIRLLGFALDDRETLEDVRCIAAPVRNPAGRVVAAISFCDEADRLSEARRQEMTDNLLEAAAEVGRRIYPWCDTPPARLSGISGKEPTAMAHAGVAL
ncbi:IclR family transcriptional regulator [Sphingomonas sp. BIUV-7]|uniref:IclR family transcriptional regulator n=1 Tax=Sphingomonas natans TaxID=3063330 RepID=A0ABT8Y3F0_9SPHN|nr:IclR family transcriptional regulator [Sphingomonas sp. BIUV-7]MDO6412833.1 IclR family transcriptional regulator [Sphingomonas sp. BIUV-7]